MGETSRQIHVRKVIPSASVRGVFGDRLPILAASILENVAFDTNIKSVALGG